MNIPNQDTCEINDNESSSSTKNFVMNKTDQDSSNSNNGQRSKKSSELEMQELSSSASSNKETSDESVERSDQQLSETNGECVEKQLQNPTKSFNSMTNDFQYQPDNASCVEEFIKNQLQDHPKDRLFMLNIEKELIKFLNDNTRDNYKFQSMNPFYRMLVHRISDYFGLGHNVDQLKQSVIVFKTEKTKMPVLNFQSIITSSNENSNETQQTTPSSSNSGTSSTSITPNSSSLNLINEAHSKPSEDHTSTNSNDDTTSIKTQKLVAQIQKKQILKREVNNNDLVKNKLDQKSSSEIKTKTFEEKSADYIRIKNRIFNTNENANDISATPDINDNLISETNSINNNNSNDSNGTFSKLTLTESVRSKQQFSILNRPISSSGENKNSNSKTYSPNVPNMKQNVFNKQTVISSNLNGNINNNIGQKHPMTNSPKDIIIKHPLIIQPENSNNITLNGTNIGTFNQQNTQRNNFAQSTVYHHHHSQNLQNHQNNQQPHLNNNETTVSIQQQQQSLQSQPPSGPYYLINHNSIHPAAYSNSSNAFHQQVSSSNSTNSFHLLTNSNGVQNNNSNTSTMNANGYNLNQIQATQVMQNQYIKSYATDTEQQSTQNATDSNSSYLMNNNNNNNNQQHYVPISQQQQIHHFAQQQQKQPMIQPHVSNPNRNSQITNFQTQSAQNYAPFQVINQPGITLPHHPITSNITMQQGTHFHNSKHSHQVSLMTQPQIATANLTQQVVLNQNTNLNIIDSANLTNNNQINNNSLYHSINQNDRQLYNQNLHGNSNGFINPMYNGQVAPVMGNNNTNKSSNNFPNQSKTYTSNNNNTMSSFELNSNYHQAPPRYNGHNLKTMSNRETGKMEQNFNNNGKLQRKTYQRSSSNNNNQNIVSSPFRVSNNSMHHLNTNQSITLPMQVQNQIQNSNSFVNMQQPVAFNGSSNIPANSLLRLNNPIAFSNMHNIVSNANLEVPQRNTQATHYQQQSAQSQLNTNHPYFTQNVSYNSNQNPVFKPSTNMNMNNYQIQKQQNSKQINNFNKVQNQPHQKTSLSISNSNGQPQITYYTNNKQQQNVMQANSQINMDANKTVLNSKQTNFSVSKKIQNKQQSASLSSSQDKTDANNLLKADKNLKSSNEQSTMFEQKQVIDDNLNENIPDVINLNESTILPILSTTENCLITNESSKSEMKLENTPTTTTTTTITVQVYNLKQDLTKQMLKDLLNPHVASIDFKSKTKFNDDVSFNDDNCNFNSIINEEIEDVFIKFENLEKLRQAIKLFNFNEEQINGKKQLQKNEKDSNKSQEQETANKNDSPFLFRQLTIY